MLSDVVGVSKDILPPVGVSKDILPPVPAIPNLQQSWD